MLNNSTMKFHLLMVLVAAFAAAAQAAQINSEQQHRPSAQLRPSFVQDALAKNQSLYYFGIGSNMLRSKVETRGVDGTPIEIERMEAAVVRNHRLAFNLRGFVPIEPAMGALEPCETSSSPLLAYEKPECHGALIKLSPENYERIMQSEGVGPNATQPGYEEVIVEAFPYGGGPPVSAVSLRARPHVRLSKDAAPSRRYINMLQEGAKELGLKPCYQSFLGSHPVQFTPKWLKKIAIYNLIFTFTMSMKLKWRGFSKLQNFFLFRVYVPPSSSPLKRHASNLASAMLLLPGSFIGTNIRMYRKLTGTGDSPFLKRMFTLLEGDEDQDSSKSEEQKVVDDKPVTSNTTVVEAR